MDYLKKPSTSITPESELAFELLNAVTKVHINHLSVNGVGSYASHKAMNEFYDTIGGLADDFIEQYQGATEKLMLFPTSCEMPQMKTKEECISYLKGLYDKVNNIQSQCKYSEIKNTLDEIKSLINSTKYKLLFLG